LSILALDKGEVEAIERLGLTEYEARVYLALLKKGPKTASEVASFLIGQVPSTEIPQSIKHAINRLLDEGLLLEERRVPKEHTLAVSPESFRLLSDRLAQIESNLRKTQNTIELLEQFQEAQREKGKKESKPSPAARLASLAIPFVAALVAGLLLGISTSSFTFIAQPLVTALVAGLLTVVIMSVNVVWRAIKTLVGQ
jgi:F0F1-type ATP synthase assembly protein I